jgi:hypothetical protein
VFKNLLKFFDADPDLGSGIFLTMDLGWKKFGFGINIPDPQHWYLHRKEKNIVTFDCLVGRFADPVQYGIRIRLFNWRPSKNVLILVRYTKIE